jgi:hypothetical protein
MDCNLSFTLPLPQTTHIFSHGLHGLFHPRMVKFGIVELIALPTMTVGPFAQYVTT